MKFQVKLYNRQFIQALFGSSRKTFHSDAYLRHTARRLEHLASLGLPIENKKVLEVGAGIGDHTSFYIDRNCKVVITEGRQKNINLIRRRFPTHVCIQLDLENPLATFDAQFDIVHCYGLLYHLSNPAKAIHYLSQYTNGFLILETCVSRGLECKENVVFEPSLDPSQALSGKGCRPTRSWIFNQLKENFKYVYVPRTQPYHEQFPLDWKTSSDEDSEDPDKLSRSIFIGSNIELNNPILLTELPLLQTH